MWQPSVVCSCGILIVIALTTPGLLAQYDAILEKTPLGDGEAACTGYVKTSHSDDYYFCADADNYAAAIACYESGDNFDGDNMAYRCHSYNGGDASGIDPAQDYLVLDYAYAGDKCDHDGPSMLRDNSLQYCYDFEVNEGGAEGGCPTTTVMAVECHDINECDEGAHRNCTGANEHDCQIGTPCGPRALCANTIGSYTCTCPPEFAHPDSAADDLEIGCLDTNECALDPTLCGIDECMNCWGSYTCQCRAGRDWFEADKECQNSECPVVNDDITNAFLKSPLPGNSLEYNSVTLDVAATYQCEAGYVPSHGAEDDGVSFKLHCQPDQTYCPCTMPRCEKKVCQIPPYDPHAVMVVKNTDTGGDGRGVFEDTAEYTCLPGFTSDYTRTCAVDGSWTAAGSTCEDIKECDESTYPCSPNTECYNTIGSFECHCDLGYTGAGTLGSPCTPISCGEIPEIHYGERTTMITADIGTYGVEVDYQCRQGYRSSSSRDRLSRDTNIRLICRADGIYEPNPIPECVPITCPDPGFLKYAERIGGSFKYEEQVQFICIPGFRPRNAAWDPNNRYNTMTLTCGVNGWETTSQGPTECEDINECETLNNPCGAGNHQCRNFAGGFRCSCDAGYKKDADGRCVGFPIQLSGGADITACDVMTQYGMCGLGSCILVDGYPRCRCNDGYDGDRCDKPLGRREDEFKAKMIGIVSISLSSGLLVVTILIIMCMCIRIPSEQVFVQGPPPLPEQPLTHAQLPPSRRFMQRRPNFPNSRWWHGGLRNGSPSSWNW